VAEEIVVRPLRAADLEGWKPLWRGYTGFYRAELGEDFSAATFRRLCEEEDGLFGLLAARGEELVGLAHLVIHASTWSDAPSCYLQDLFVDPAERGGAVAVQLFEALYAAARERGADRVYWHTQQFNSPARSLYDTVGQLTSFIVYEQGLGDRA